MSKYTAIVLSAHPITHAYEGVITLPCMQRIASNTELHEVRLKALAKVKTPYCFFLDDDDELPTNYLEVLDACVTANVAVAYTDELEVGPTSSDVRTAPEYDLARHAREPMAIHHLALMNTAEAVRVANFLPRGEFWTEHLLYYFMAKAGGAKRIPQVGYHWHRSGTGFSAKPSTIRAQLNSSDWIGRYGDQWL